jgi:hypothetical protein
MKSASKLFLLGSALVFLANCCPDEANCRECAFSVSQKLGRCLKCEFSYSDADSKQCKTSFSSVLHCQEYDFQSSSTCSECELGYFLFDETNQCLKCQIPNCAYCSGYEKCDGCFDGMSLSEDKKSCLANTKCSTSNCKICIKPKDVEYCRVCNDGYSFADQDSMNCVPGPPNCTYFISNFPKKCITCNQGFYIANDGTCKSSKELLDKVSFAWLLLGGFTLAFAALSILVYKLILMKGRKVSMYGGAR